MNKNRILQIVLLFIAFVAITNTSCVRKKFDNPEDVSTYDPKLTVTGTLQDVKNKYTAPYAQITSDITVAVYVSADDRSGSFYKTIMVQDSTTGIAVKIGQSGLYNNYPVGRKIYIKCKGLYIGSYGNFLQIGGAPDMSGSLSDISLADAKDHIIVGPYNPQSAEAINILTPKKLTISQLKSINTNAKYLGMLVQIADSVEFIDADAGQIYAENATISSGTDRNIEDCNSNKIVARNSAYANFAGTLTPTGRGTIVAIYSRYNNTPQLVLRDTTDVKCNAVRCGGVVIQPATDITIDSLRKAYTGTSISAKAYKIHGVVISSRVDSSISKGNLVVQDESGKGVLIYFGQNEVGKNLGDSVTIELDSLTTYGGVLEAKATLSKMTLVGTGKSVAAATVTIADLNTDLNKTINQRIYESKLVRITGCTITGSPATYSGPNVADRSKTVTDATGNITMYSQPTTPFKTTNYPTGTNLSITAIGSKFNTTNQIQIRKFSDVF